LNEVSYLRKERSILRRGKGFKERQQKASDEEVALSLDGAEGNLRI